MTDSTDNKITGEALIKGYNTLYAFVTKIAQCYRPGELISRNAGYPPVEFSPTETDMCLRLDGIVLTARALTGVLPVRLVEEEEEIPEGFTKEEGDTAQEYFAERQGEDNENG